MTKDELSELVEHANACFNRDIPPSGLKSQKKAWWALLGDLDASTVMRHVNAAAVSGGYMPRPGDLRRLVIVGTVPDALEAWEELQDCRHRVANGEDPKRLSDLTRRTVLRLGDTAMGLNTNGDREAFTRLYQRVVDEYVVEKCAP